MNCRKSIKGELCGTTLTNHSLASPSATEPSSWHNNTDIRLSKSVEGIPSSSIKVTGEKSTNMAYRLILITGTLLISAATNHPRNKEGSRNQSRTDTGMQVSQGLTAPDQDTNEAAINYNLATYAEGHKNSQTTDSHNHTNLSKSVTTLVPNNNFGYQRIKRYQLKSETQINNLPSAAQQAIRPVAWRPANIQLDETTTTGTQGSTLESSSAGSFYMLMFLLMSLRVRRVPQSFCALNVLLSSSTNAQQLIGFDTAGRFAGDRKITMKVISLLSVDPCDRIRSQSYSSPVERAVQLLYRPTETPIKVLQCRIVITVQILHCATSVFRSDIYPADVVMDEQVLPVTDDQCRDMQATGTFKLDLYEKSIPINNIKHTPQTFTRTLVGIKESNGACKGGEITIDGVRHKSKVVLLKVTHQARELGAKYSSSSGTIFVGDLVTFPYGVGYERRCDGHLGCFTVAVPEVIPENRCQQTEQLFLGHGQLFVPNVGPEKISQGYLEILQVTSDLDSTMGTALTLTDTENVCGVLVRKTNIPRLFANFYDDTGLVSHTLLNISRPRGNPYAFLDVLTSSSNIYLRGSLSVSEQFDRVSFRLCELRRLALNNVLRDLITAGPSPLLNYRRGLLFIKKGSVAYVFIGVPIIARLRNTELCYNEIPVTLETQSHGEVEAFLTSKGRIIVSNGTSVQCSNQSPMHFLRDFQDEMTIFNDSESNHFPDLAFSDEDDNPHVKGNWVCQIANNFIACQPPSSLSPIIRSNDHFFGIRGAFMSQSIFGHDGREGLYRSQVEGFNREVFLSKIGPSSDGQVPSDAGDLFINHLSETARNQIRKIVLPNLYLVFGSLVEYIEQFIIAIFIVSFIMEFVKMIMRLGMIFKYYGCSRYLLFAFCEGLWNAIIPWRSAARQKDRVIERLEAEVNELESKMSRKVDRISDPAELMPSRPRVIYPSLPRRLEEMTPIPRVSFPPNPSPNAPPADPNN